MNSLGKKRSWDKFNYSDWLRDHALRRCKASTRGIWMDVLALMFEGDEVGYLSISGEPWAIKDIARAIGERPETVERALSELIEKKVCSVREADQVIYSRRMVRDYEAYLKGTQNGKKGGNPVLKASTKSTENVQKTSTICTENEHFVDSFADNIGGNQPENECGGLTLEIRSKNKEIRSKNSTPYSPPKTGGLVEVEAEPSQPKRTRKQTSLAISEPLPDWMPLEAWNGYLEMRIKTRNKPTERAISLAIKKLDGFRQQGQSVEEILNQSTLRNWTGLFPVKQDCASSGSNFHQSNRPKTNRDVANSIREKFGFFPRWTEEDEAACQNDQPLSSVKELLK